MEGSAQISQLEKRNNTETKKIKSTGTITYTSTEINARYGDTIAGVSCYS